MSRKSLLICVLAGVLTVAGGNVVYMKFSAGQTNSLATGSNLALAKELEKKKKDVQEEESRLTKEAEKLGWDISCSIFIDAEKCNTFVRKIVESGASVELGNYEIFVSDEFRVRGLTVYVDADSSVTKVKEYLAKKVAPEIRTEKLRDSLEQAVRRRGWNVGQSVILGNADYVKFLEKLLASKTVVNTGDVKIYASDRFEVYAGSIYVDARASIEEIIAYLQN